MIKFKKIVDSLMENIALFNYDKVEKVEDIDKLTFERYLKCINKINFKNYTVVEIKDNKYK